VFPARLVCLLAVAGTLLGGVAFAAMAPPKPHRTAPAGPRFKVSGNVIGRLHPGAATRVRLKVANPNGFAIVVKSLGATTSVDRAHARSGCRAQENFFLAPGSRPRRPLRLRPHAVVRFVGVRAARAPQVVMRDLKSNQDACKGARITLRYRGTAVRVRAGR
jgi:hypothetical protein